MKQVILLNGANRVGKDEMCNISSQYHLTRNISTVDKVRIASKYLGMKGKTENDRRFMSDLKLLADKHYNHSIEYIKEQYNEFLMTDEELMFVHCREPYNLATLKPMLNAITLLIRNPRVQQITSNMADANVENYDYDYIIVNDGTLEEYDDKIREFLGEIG